jgi:hypothetical protein
LPRRPAASRGDEIRRDGSRGRRAGFKLIVNLIEIGIQLVTPRIVRGPNLWLDEAEGAGCGIRHVRLL